MSNQQEPQSSNEQEHSNLDFGSNGIEEVTGWTRVCANHCHEVNRTTTRRRWENPVKTSNPFEPLQAFDDEEFPALNNTDGKLKTSAARSSSGDSSRRGQP